MDLRELYSKRFTNLYSQPTFQNFVEGLENA